MFLFVTKTLTSIRIILVVSTLFLFSSAFSQKNYSKATVVTLDGETLHGLIDYKNWEINPKKISFKESHESRSKDFFPAEILEFRVEDALYISAFVEIESSSSLTDDLDHYESLELYEDTVFLQTFFEGEKCLFLYKEAEGKENFYIGPSDNPQLLLYKRYLRDVDGTNIISEKKTYQGQLTYYLNDCPDINKIAGNTKYTLESMEKLFEYYYKNTPREARFIKKSEKTIFKFGIVAGATHTTLNIQGEDLHNLADLNLSPSINPSAGLLMDIIFARKIRNMSLYNELIFTTFSTGDEFISAGSAYYTSTYVTEIGLSYINLVNMFRYKYFLDNFGLFLQGGFSNGFVINETNSITHITKYSGVERVTVTDAVYDLRTHEQGLVCGLGCQYGSFSLEGRYMVGNGIEWGMGLQTTTNRWFLLMSFRF